MPLPPRSALPALLRRLRRLVCPPAAQLRSRPAPAATPMDGPQAEALLAPLRQAVRQQVTRLGPAEGGVVVGVVVGGAPPAEGSPAEAGGP